MKKKKGRKKKKKKKGRKKKKKKKGREIDMRSSYMR